MKLYRHIDIIKKYLHKKNKGKGLIPFQLFPFVKFLNAVKKRVRTLSL